MERRRLAREEAERQAKLELERIEEARKEFGRQQREEEAIREASWGYYVAYKV